LKVTAGNTRQGDSVAADNNRLVRPPARKVVESDEQFRLLVSQVVDYAIFMLDTEGYVATWNEGAQRIKGYSAGEIVGRHFSTFYPPRDVRAGKPQRELRLATRVGRFEDEGWRVRKDGTRFWANVVITAIRDAKGELRGFAKVTRDMSSRREEELRQRREQRRESVRLREHAQRMSDLERIKSDFLNLASHELRGPLTLVRGYMSMIEEGDVTPEEIPALAPLLSGKLLQMELLVKQMLETARLEQDRFELQTERFDLREVVRDLVTEFRPMVASSHTLTLHEPKVPVTVRADRARIGTAVANLIDNAIKYSNQGGRIDLTVGAAEGKAFARVQDRGLGIATDQLDELFVRFGRLDTEENVTIGGTGLGLYLSREIARRHGGDIAVESELGRGSSFTLTLPLASPRLD
jgi:PAS domain S-box-containing protein